MASFTHEPISLVGPVSRLLRLHKGRYDEIKCDLFEAWIGDSSGGMPYSALSYTWGTSTKSAAITVNGCLMNVTTNLLTALQHLRLADEDRILWIDAICIDQDNNQERTHQVQHMGRIYQEAEKVLIWLGTGNAKSDITMDAMTQAQLDIIRRQGDWGNSSTGSLRTRANVDRQKLHYDREGPETLICEGLEEMLERPWFRRVWILQEVANARVAIVHCGTKSVSARIFAQFPATVGFPPRHHIQAVLDIMPGLSRKESWWGQDRTLHTLLTKFGQSEASDERDNIYALLGISSDAGKSDILLPDYKKSLQDVVCDIARFLLQSIGFSLNLASFFEYFDWNQKRPFEVFTSNQFRGIFLDIACEHENVALVRFLLSAVGTRLDGSFKHKRQPLITAVSKRNIVLLKLLLEDGIHTDVASSLNSSLLEAVTQNEEEIVGILLDYRTRFNLQNGNIESMENNLTIAATQGHEGMVKLLLKALAGSPALKNNTFSFTPLNRAVENGNDATVKLIIEYMSSKSMFGGCWSAIALAAERGHENIVRSLTTYIRQGPDIFDNYSFNAALCAAMRHNEEGIIQLLLEQDISPAPSRRWHADSLCVAAAQGRLEVIERLLQLGVHLNSADDKFCSSLFLAIRNRHFRSVKLLLERGALSELEPRTHRGFGPLSFAIKMRNTRIVKLLIGWGENIDTRDQHMETQKWLAEKGITCEMSNLGILISAEERERLLEEISQEQ